MLPIHFTFDGKDFFVQFKKFAETVWFGWIYCVALDIASLNFKQ
jgi:hypothetical protein